MEVTRTEYKISNDKPEVWVFCREDGKRKIIKDSSLIPYFYVPEIEIGNNITDNQDYYTVFGEVVRKVLTRYPGEVPQMREGFSKTWEADIPFHARYLLDKVDIIDPTELRVLYVDIETTHTGRVPSPMGVPEPIIAVTIYDTLDNVYTSLAWRSDVTPGKIDTMLDDSLHEIWYFKDEYKMLTKLAELIAAIGPDIITGWNSNQFDLPYIINRLEALRLGPDKLSPMGYTEVRQKEHSIEPIIKGTALIDMLDLYRRFTFSMEESYTLAYIGNKVTGKDKISVENINWTWRYDLEKLIKYNAMDVNLVVNIDKNRRLIEFLDEIRRTSHCQFEDAMVAGRIMDYYVLKMFHGQYVFPTKQHHEKHEFQGAIVGLSHPGIHEGVAVLDLKSLYPSILVSANLSSECIRDIIKGPHIEVNGLQIDITRQGYLPQVIESLFANRAKYKAAMKKCPINSPEWKLYDNRQFALKTLLNAIYGQTAYPNSRYYDPRIAETITYLGREIITWSKNFLENLGFEVVYLDTDSQFCKFGQNCDPTFIQSVVDELNESYSEFCKKYGIQAHKFEMQFDKIYRKVFFSSAKKRYAGMVIYKDGQETSFIETIGFETRRSDASQFSKKLMITVFDMLLKQNSTQEEVIRYIGSEIDRFRKGEVSLSEMGIPKGMSRELSEYDHAPSNIRGAKYTQDVLGITLSSKPKMLYISKMPEHLVKTDVLCFDDPQQVPPGTVVDIEKMLDKLVKLKMTSIFEALGWKLSELSYHWKGKPKNKKGDQLVLF